MHQLPAELWLDIIDYISTDTTSVLCMQLVARDFFPLFEAPFFILPEERDAFKAALRRDDLTWYSKLEQLNGLDELAQAVCSACESRHRKSQFKPEELAKGPQQRRCIGAEETVVLNGRTATFNEVFDCTPEACQRNGIAAVYISKSATNQSVRKPTLETIVAHVTDHRRLEVTFHFRHSPSHGDEHAPAESLQESFLSTYDLICPQLQAKLMHCETITRDEKPIRQKAFRKLQKHTPGVYDRWGYQWHNCVCRAKTCDHTICSEEFLGCKAQDEKAERTMVLTVWRTYRADMDSAAPDWARSIVMKLVHQQSNLNADGGMGAGIRLHAAKEKGKWSCEDGFS
jgi:hypothetical protein